jgi:large subunit ribosomal protein L25
VTIDIDVKQHLAQVREKQRDFIKNRRVNLEFQVVSLTEKMWSKVGIELTGIAPAVKNFNTVIHTGLTAMEVECIPQDLAEWIVVDLSGIAELGTASASEEIERGRKK